MWHTMKSPTPLDCSTFPSISSTYLPRKTTPLLSTSYAHYDKGKTHLATDSTSNTMSRTLSLSNTGTHRPKRQLRLTNAEFQARREKGLCFHNEEKFQPGHKCKKQLNILLVHDEDEDALDDVESDWSSIGIESVEVSAMFIACVSCNSVSGLSKRSTMKLQGKLYDFDIIILIDPGATHNFICDKLAKELQLPLTPAGRYRIVLGDGLVVYSQGKYSEVPTTTQDIMAIDEFLPLSLSSIHIILGKQWLDSIGWVHLHFQKLIMKFIIDGEVQTLRGNPNLHKKVISADHEAKGLFRGNVFMAKLYLIEDSSSPFMEVSTHLALETQLQNQFPDVFDNPQELPPHRNIDHAINLVPGALIINKRPYRYSYVQKNEVEKLIGELLAAGLCLETKFLRVLRH